MNIRRKRIMALVNTWSKIVRDNIVSRGQAVEILRKCYEELGVEPIRGASLSHDLYDKDMGSLYIVGKWGLGIDKELSKEVLENLFSTELRIEHVVEKIQRVSSFDELCKEDADTCKSIDDKLTARILRFVFTLYYFGFIDRTMFIQLIRKIYSVLKPAEETVRRFARFIIAYEVGKKIAESEIKSRIDLNMAKNTVALDIGIPNALPSLSYIIEVAKHFFELPQDLINSLKS